MPIDAPQHLAHLPSAVLTAIHAACDGDWRRVTLDDDGGFTVHNKPQFRRVELPPEADTARKLGLAPAPVRRARKAAPRSETASVATARPTVTATVPAAPQAAPTPSAATPRPAVAMPAAVAFLPPAARAVPVPPVAPAVEQPAAAAPASVRDADAVDVPRHPRYLRARLRALGATVGEVDDDGNAAVFVGQEQVALVPMVDYRSKSVVRAWRDVLAQVQAHTA